MKIAWLFFLLIFFKIPAQGGFQATDGKKTVIPFRLINNLIFIPVQINGVELTFMLDSGVSETLLFSLENKQVDFQNLEKMKFTGLGGDMEIEGYKAINNSMKIGTNFEDKAHQIFIILNEEFNFSSHIGIPVNGIIGYQFFRNFPVKIDYVSKKITVFTDSKKFAKEKANYENFPISVEFSKPYIIAGVQQTQENVPSKMLLDLGNSDALWLFPSLIPGFAYNRPNVDDYLGRGFNGDIFGKRSRINSLNIGKFRLEKPLTAMPDESSLQNLKIVKDRKGSVGSETLRRFHIIFDYPGNSFYLKKNKNYDDPFLFNMSGLDIKHDGMLWSPELVEVNSKKAQNEASPAIGAQEISLAPSKFQYKFVLKPKYSVAGSRPGSVAYNAGVRKGDLLVTINKKNVSEMSLDEINNIFKKAEGFLLTLQVLRDNKPLQFQFTLQDPIPYQE